MPTTSSIVDILQAQDEQTVASLSKKTGKSRQYVHRELLKLIKDGKVIKLGASPLTYYRLLEEVVAEPEEIYLPKGDSDFLDDHFFIVTELGEKLSGIEAMRHWSYRQKLPLAKTISEYISTRKKYLDYFNRNHLIDGLQKLKSTKGFDKINLDELFYLDFYAIERFGKTRLGTLMHYAKQGQNKNLMKQIVDEIKYRVYKTAELVRADAVLFVPPTIKRSVQIMNYLQQNLKIKLPLIEVKKIKGEIVIPQKALSKIHERISNAQYTFGVPDQKSYKRILMIDDAVGSGATMNEIAGKLKKKGLADKITGLAITGSFKGFEVIHEI